MNTKIIRSKNKSIAVAQKQRGVALAVSLLLLVAMTIIGVSTLTGTRLNEQITGNAQQKAIAFEAAESAISSVWDSKDLMASVENFPLSPYDNPAVVNRDDLDSALSSNFDQTYGEKSAVDIEAEVSIQYCGETSRPEGTSLSADESGLQLVGVLFDVNGNASIKNSKTRSDHLQRARISRPKSGRGGNCKLRGL